jgi:hypothetical protein
MFIAPPPKYELYLTIWRANDRLDDALESVPLLEAACRRVIAQVFTHRFWGRRPFCAIRCARH